MELNSTTPTAEDIKSNVLKLQNANATLDDIENYVRFASQEMSSQTREDTPQRGAFESTPYDPNAGFIGNVGAYAGNVVKDIPQGLSDLGQIPGAFSGLARDVKTNNPQSPAGGYPEALARGEVELGKTLAGGVSGIGNMILGGVSSAARNVFGKSISPQSEQSGETAAEGMAQGAFQRPLSTAVTLDTLAPKGTSAVSEIARPIIDTTKKMAQPVLRPVASYLKTSAEESIAKALAPTTNANKALTERITPEILNRPMKETYAFSRQGLEEKAIAGKEKAGEAMDSFGEIKGQTDTAKIVSTLEKEKGQFMAGGKIVDEAGWKKVDDIQKLISSYGEKIDNETLRGVRRIYDKQVARTKGGFALPPSEGTALDVTKTSADIFRNELAKTDPDLAKLNKEYNFWSNFQKVISATNERIKPQSGFTKDLATLGGAVSGHGAIDIAVKALTFRWIAGLIKSTGWRLLSARIKNGIADAISTGDFSKANDFLSKEAILPNARLPFTQEWQDLKNQKSEPVSELNTRIPTINKKPISNASISPNPITLAPKKEIPKELESLAQEARKYKSAEEFVNSKIGKAKPVYHGTTEMWQGDAKYPLYLSENKTYAEHYANSKIASSITTYAKKGDAMGTVKEFYPANPKRVLDIRKEAHANAIQDYWKESVSGMQVPTKTGLPDWTEGESLAQFIEENKLPFDAIKVDEGGIINTLTGKVEHRGIGFVAINKDALQTKSQLTDFYNQVMKGKKELPILAKENQVPKYHVFIQGKGFVPVEGKSISIIKGVDTFIVHDAHKWTVSEGKTGMRVAEGKTRTEAIRNATQILNEKKNQIESAINASVKERGMSPIYLKK